MSLSPKTETHLFYIILSLIVLCLIGINVYQYLKTQELNATIAVLVTERNELIEENASTTRQLEVERADAVSTINELSERLSLTAEELSDIERDLKKEKNRNDEFQDQINNIVGTVGVLDKLSKTDKELLQKYSRTYFLNENFIPMKLSQIPKKYVMDPAKDAYFHGDAIKFLTNMLDTATKAGHEIKVISAYRSFDEQTALKSQYSIVYGSGANAFSADQGYSEHQLGTTVDIVDTVTRFSSEAFANTEAYAWLEKNAYKYGFILSYPEGNNFYVYEPWHWRFVGRSLAEDLHNDNKNYYQLDQRELDKYLIKIFD